MLLSHQQIIEKYKHNPTDFINVVLRGLFPISALPDETVIHLDEVSGVSKDLDKDDLSWQQEWVLKSLEAQPKISVSFCDYTLKGLFKEISIWWIVCHTEKDLAIFSNHIDSIVNEMWLSKIIKQSPYHHLLTEIIKNKDIHALNPKFKNSFNKIANLNHPLVIVLGADQTVKNKEFEDFLKNIDVEKIILFGRPVQEYGFFFDTHHSLSKFNGGEWSTLLISAEESPFVKTEYLEKKIAEYGGRDTEKYTTHIKGEFYQQNVFTQSSEKVDQFRARVKKEQDNLRLELDLLAQRIHLGNVNNDALYWDEEALLIEEQYGHMVAYNKVLQKRIELYKQKPQL